MSELVDNLQGVLVVDFECLPENPAKKYFLKMYSNDCGTDRVIVFEEEEEGGGGEAYTAGTGLGLTANEFSITDPELLAILGLTSAADRLPYFTGSGTAALATFTAFARTLMDDADATAARTTLGLGDLATLSTLSTAGDVTSTYLAGTLTITIANNAITTAKIINDAVTYAKMQNVSVTQRVLGRNTAGAGDVEEVTLSQLLDWVGSAADGDILYRAAGSRTRLAAGTNTHVLTLAAGVPTRAAPSGGGSGAYWTAIPTVTRVSDTQFTVPDVGNASLLNLVLSRLTCLKWTDTGVTKQAMVISASYSANVVTVNIIGDTLAATATMTTFKYGYEKARKLNFAIAGVIAATATDAANKHQMDCAAKIFGADFWLGTAGTTNPNTIDINKNGTTMFTTKPSIASTQVRANGTSADTGTITGDDDFITLDIDAVSTTKAQDLYASLFYTPLYNQYYT